MRAYALPCPGVAMTAAGLLFLPACALGLSGEGPNVVVGDDAGVGSTQYGPAVDGSVQTAAARDAGVGRDGAPAAVRDASFDARVEAQAADAIARDAAGDQGDESSPLALPAPIGAWSFDEGAGAASADLSGHGHAAVLVAGASWGPGKEGAGLVLDGTSGYADVGVALVDTRASFSVVSWAKLATIDAWAVAVSEDDVNGSMFGLKLRGDATNDFDFDFETSDVVSPGFVVAQSVSRASADVWVHLAGVYDATGTATIKVYVDGVLEATSPVSQAFAPASGHLVMGRGLYNGLHGSFLHGTLDEVAVYDAALSDAQVAAIYAAER
jgi:hypothetical protein